MLLLDNFSFKRKIIIIPAFLLLLCGCNISNISNNNTGQLVVVAGATGGTGRAVVKNLLAQGYQVRAFVRDEAKAKVVLGANISYALGDVRDLDTIYPALDGADFIISAIGSSRSDPTNNPEAVDFKGIKNLADASSASEIKQFVLVSSSGATQEDHFLNKNFDNILKWKLKGENALRASGVAYTIVRPGGLINSPAREFSVIFEQGDTGVGRISREDVALICIASLQLSSSRGKTFEAFNTEIAGENNWKSLFGELSTD
ncbi:MAG: SDR family oxidoreductase [Pseudomonadota bacterium]|nr:SDR family oxidoreductase [Pseudomonadota bacterium]